jgi:5-methylcytosine-specific restriction endonuclease McrA
VNLKKKKTPSLKNLRNKSDGLFSKACFKIYGDKCEVCGKQGHGVHHFFPRSISAFLRFNTKNGIILCYHCHIIRIHSQGDPRVYEEIIKRRGQEWYEELKRLKLEGESKGGFMGVEYYRKNIERLQEIVDK